MGTSNPTSIRRVRDFQGLIRPQRPEMEDDTERPTGCLMRWCPRLTEFDYEILYRPSRVHKAPDPLSRIPQPATNIYPELEDELPCFDEVASKIAEIELVMTRTKDYSN